MFIFMTNLILNKIFNIISNENDYCISYIKSNCTNSKCEKIHSYILKYRFSKNPYCTPIPTYKNKLITDKINTNDELKSDLNENNNDSYIGFTWRPKSLLLCKNFNCNCLNHNMLTQEQTSLSLTFELYIKNKNIPFTKIINNITKAYNKNFNFILELIDNYYQDNDSLESENLETDEETVESNIINLESDEETVQSDVINLESNSNVSDLEIIKSNLITEFTEDNLSLQSLEKLFNVIEYAGKEAKMQIYYKNITQTEYALIFEIFRRLRCCNTFKNFNDGNIYDKENKINYCFYGRNCLRGHHSFNGICRKDFFDNNCNCIDNTNKIKEIKNQISKLMTDEIYDDGFISPKKIRTNKNLIKNLKKEIELLELDKLIHLRKSNLIT